MERSLGGTYMGGMLEGGASVTPTWSVRPCNYYISAATATVVPALGQHT